MEQVKKKKKTFFVRKVVYIENVIVLYLAHFDYKAYAVSVLNIGL